MWYVFVHIFETLRTRYLWQKHSQSTIIIVRLNVYVGNGYTDFEVTFSARSNFSSLFVCLCIPSNLHNGTTNIVSLVQWMDRYRKAFIYNIRSNSDFFFSVYLYQNTSFSLFNAKWWAALWSVPFIFIISLELSLTVLYPSIRR